MQLYYSLKNEVYLKLKKEIATFLRQTFIQKCRWICSELCDSDVEMPMDMFWTPWLWCRDVDGYVLNLYDYGKASHMKQWLLYGAAANHMLVCLSLNPWKPHYCRAEQPQLMLKASFLLWLPHYTTVPTHSGFGRRAVIFWVLGIICLFVFVVWNRVILFCSSSFPGAHCLNQTGLKLTEMNLLLLSPKY